MINILNSFRKFSFFLFIVLPITTILSGCDYFKKSNDKDYQYFSALKVVNSHDYIEDIKFIDKEEYVTKPIFKISKDYYILRTNKKYIVNSNLLFKYYLYILNSNFNVILKLEETQEKIPNNLNDNQRLQWFSEQEKNIKYKLEGNRLHIFNNDKVIVNNSNFELIFHKKKSNLYRDKNLYFYDKKGKKYLIPKKYNNRIKQPKYIDLYIDKDTIIDSNKKILPIHDDYYNPLKHTNDFFYNIQLDKDNKIILKKNIIDKNKYELISYFYKNMDKNSFLSTKVIHYYLNFYNLQGKSNFTFHDGKGSMGTNELYLKMIDIYGKDTLLNSIFYNNFIIQNMNSSNFLDFYSKSKCHILIRDERKFNNIQKFDFCKLNK